MEVSSSTDHPPTQQVELVPERIEDLKIEDVKEKGPSFYCDLCDAELVHKIAQAFLPALATACVDNTTGGLFRSPGTVAADIRKEMVDNITLRSETFVAETVILEGGPEAEKSDHPFDIISDFMDDFASSKRNLFSRVSGWLLSEKREDKVDDFVQEMEVNGFWLLDKREAVAQTLLKNIDFKNAFHCDKKFNSPEELAEHVPVCGFRSMTCENEGCNARFSANQSERHDSICPFKIIPCEQKCLDSIMRREMDRHCITVCPMKVVNCPFYAVGCQSTVPSCMIEKHHSKDLQSHLLYVLQGIHKEASVEDLTRRIEQLEKVQKDASTGKLADARDARSLTSRIKNLEAKLGPLEITTPKKADKEITKTADKDAEERLDSLEVGAKSKDSEEEARETEAKECEAKLEPLEVSAKNRDSQEAEQIAARDSEAKLESVEISVKNKDSQGTEETAAKDSDTELASIEVSVKNKGRQEAEVTSAKDSQATHESVEVGKNEDSPDAGEIAGKDSETKLEFPEGGEEAGETVVKDSEAKLELSEGGEKAGETAVKDSKAKLDSLEVSNESQDSKDAGETAIKDSEAKLKSIEGYNKNKDTEPGEAIVSESKPQSSEAIPAKQESKKSTELTPKDVEEKPRHSEPSATNKSSEEGSETTKHILQAGGN